MPAEESNKVKTNIAAIIEKARAAQKIYAHYDQAQVDEVVTAVGWTLINKENNHLLTGMAIKDTGLGNYDETVFRRTTGSIVKSLGGANLGRGVGEVGAVVDDNR